MDGLRKILGRLASAKSQLFYEGAWNLHDEHGRPVTSFQTGFMQERAIVHGSVIERADEGLSGCVRLIDRTNIKIFQHNRQSKLQPSTYNDANVNIDYPIKPFRHRMR